MKENQDYIPVSESDYDVSKNNQNMQSKQIPGTNVKKEIGTTQGRKGFKLKRMTMALSDDNHSYVFAEAARIGISATAFINQVLDLYREEHPIK